VEPAVEDAAARRELLEATNEQIEDAMAHADPMVLRGLLYQLTGDEEVAATTVKGAGTALAAVEDPAEVARLRAKAVAYLEAHRDAGTGPLDIGPAERLPRSLALAAGVDELPPRDLPIWLEELALDPWVRGLDWEGATPTGTLESFSVVVIGAGMGGLNAAAQLAHAGIDFTVLEKNSGVGGTWHENRYPGARVDSPSRAYVHIFGVDYSHPYPWCPWQENQRYFNWVADTFGVREHIAFDTEVVSLTWNEGTSKWEIEAKGPEGRRVLHANVVISAVGLLSRPRLPEIEGMGDFAGRSFHTARWPEDIDLADARVAVIGTGCSGTQLVPELARLAGHVTVYQRTPQWLFEHKGYLSPYAPQVGWLDRNFPYHTHFTRFRAHWLLGPDLSKPFREMDPTFDDPHAPSAVHKRIREERIAFIERKLAGRPELIEKMIPPHPPFSTRPVQVDSDYCYYDAFLRDNVTLVTEEIARITPSGVRTTDGAEHAADVIVYATGFRANECLWPMDVRGREGRSVEELWAKDGPRAYLGVMLPGFPNFFMIYGPNMNPYGGLGVINHEEMATRYMLDCIKQVVSTGHRSVDVTEEAYWRWNDALDERERYKIYKDRRARSYYTNEHGRSSTNCPFGGNEMWHRLRTPDADDLVVR
jgi:4-hydroxyacetophenone monooxygenase